jgi:hypothetical protein
MNCIVKKNKPGYLIIGNTMFLKFIKSDEHINMGNEVLLGSLTNIGAKYKEIITHYKQSSDEVNKYYNIGLSF